MEKTVSKCFYAIDAILSELQFVSSSNSGPELKGFQSSECLRVDYLKWLCVNKKWSSHNCSQHLWYQKFLNLWNSVVVAACSSLLQKLQALPSHNLMLGTSTGRLLRMEKPEQKQRNQTTKKCPVDLFETCSIFERNKKKATTFFGISVNIFFRFETCWHQQPGDVWLCSTRFSIIQACSKQNWVGVVTLWLKATCWSWRKCSWSGVHGYKVSSTA